MLIFGRDLCGDFFAASSREWLVTNGIGGFAMGTVAGPLARRYHGLLVAALEPPLGRILMLSRLDETALYNGRAYPLFTNCWADGTVEPPGFKAIESFALDGTTPVWFYAVGDALIEKRIWMQPGANTTCIRYTLLRAGTDEAAPLKVELRIKALVNYRDYHGTTAADGWRMQVEPVAHGLRVVALPGATPLLLLCERGEATPRHTWYFSYELAFEQERGFDGVEDHLCVGELSATLLPGEAFTIIASAEPAPECDSAVILAARRRHEEELLRRARSAILAGTEREPAWITRALEQLVLAADQFIVDRTVDGAGTPSSGKTVIAGYPWFSDWGRDTMIALPGLTLPTGRPELAATVLRTFARFVDQGMLPNRFPDQGELPEYNTVDATLWYFEAIRAYHAATSDDALLGELFPVLEDIITWHQRGTRYGIGVDQADGLLCAGEAGVQLTWMDVKIGAWVVTPRTGKAVEINALWYNALCTMAGFARRLGREPGVYEEAANQVRTSFTRFWCAEAGYCYDVIDSPAGNDATLRPNQIFAVALPHSPLDPTRARAVVDVCARHLLTSHGLRSLAPDHPDYSADYLGSVVRRDSAYHQGPVWGWLIGPFVSAHLRIYGDRAVARTFLLPLLLHLNGGCVGNISEIFDAEPPFTPRGCPAQAWSVAELLRAWSEVLA